AWIAVSARGFACRNCFKRFRAALALVTPSVGAPKSATNFLLTVGDGPGSGRTGVVPRTAGSAAAPAARCRNLRRGSLISLKSWLVFFFRSRCHHFSRGFPPPPPPA